MIAPKQLFADRERLLDRRFRLSVAAFAVTDLAEIVQEGGDCALGPRCFLVGHKRPLEQRLRSALRC